MYFRLNKRQNPSCSFFSLLRLGGLTLLVLNKIEIMNPGLLAPQPNIHWSFLCFNHGPDISERNQRAILPYSKFQFHLKLVNIPFRPKEITNSKGNQNWEWVVCQVFLCRLVLMTVMIEIVTLIGTWTTFAEKHWCLTWAHTIKSCHSCLHFVSVLPLSHSLCSHFAMTLRYRRTRTNQQYLYDENLKLPKQQWAS
jgi:hypothetical protein